MKSKEATAQENKKEVITYYLYLLEKPVLVNERTIKHILISSHCDKHEKHGISKETIIELIQLLNNRYFPFSGKQPEKKNYFKVYPESHNKSKIKVYNKIMKKNQEQEIIEIPINAEEEKIFH
ncbi:3491_t:CDS:2 [Entrophospora sp. SA101]|nr:3491_t:CDS:2 [Entrophospora sp. SA101]CAJ0840899.1 997_t:CDS:2 [Entrophospora sp. SA101]